MAHPTLGTGLVYAGHFDEASGSALPAFSSHVLVETGGVVGAATGLINGARDFTTSGGFFEIADTADFRGGNRNFSFSIWVKLRAKEASMQYVVSKYETGGNLREYALLYDNTVDRWRFQITSAGTSGSVASVVATNFGSPPIDTWHKLYCGHDADNDLLIIAVNGGTRNTTSHAGGVFAGASAMRVSSVNVGGITTNRFNGLLDEFLFYSRMLTPAEDTALTNGGAGYAWPFPFQSVFICDAGSYSLTGQDAGIFKRSVITCEPGEYALTGQDAGVLKRSVIECDAGSYMLTGQDAEIVFRRAGAICAQLCVKPAVRATLERVQCRS